MELLKFGKAICYSGYRKGQSPKGSCPSKAQVAEDIKILADQGYSYIRMYDPNYHARFALEAIRENKYPMKAIVGIDSDNEVNNPGCPFEDQHYSDEQLKAHKERNDRELQKLIALAREFDDVIAAVSIGNENTPSWGQHNVPEDRLIEHAKRLHEELDLPVTFCEGCGEWPLLKRLPQYLDIISVHTYPYHIGTPVEQAVEVNKQHYAKIRELFPDKQVIITELGWSSCSNHPKEEGGRMRQSVESQKLYIDDVRKWVSEEQVIAFIFEAFDELWKGSTPRSSECNFGLYNEQRKPKF